MNAENKNQFIPSEIWTPESVDPEFDKIVDDVRREMNSADASVLVEDLKSRVKHENGIAYAILDGPIHQDYSKTDALVYFDSMSVGPSANRLVKAEFIRRVAEKKDIKDEAGKLKPVVYLSSPGPGSHLRLSREERRDLRDGNLGIAAREMLKVVEAQEFGQVALLGFSLGSGLALAGSRRENSADLGLDIHATAVGDIPTVEDRVNDFNIPVKIGSDFGKAKDLKPALAASGLNIQAGKLMAADSLRMGLGLLMPTNWQLANALSHDTFLNDAQTIINQGILDKLIIGYGDSAITKPEFIEPKLLALHGMDAKGILTSIKIPGKNHTWGDELPLLARLYMRAA